MKNRKILFITNAFYPRLGGEKHQFKVAETLVKIGNTVNVVALSHDKKLPIFENISGINVYRVNPLNIKRLRVVFWTLQWFLWFVKNISLIKDSDVVHMQTDSLFLPVYPLVKIFKKKVFFTAHGPGSQHGMDAINRFGVARFVRLLTEKTSSGVISIGIYLNKFFGTDVRYNMFGAAEEVDYLSYEKLDDKIVFVGRLEHDTSIKEYLKGIKLLKDKYNINYKVEICGGGSLKNELMDYCKNNNLETAFHGWVNNPEDYIKNAKYILAGQYLSTFEALAQNKIVFPLALGGEVKVYCWKTFPRYKNLYISYSIEEFVENLYQVIKNDIKPIYETIPSWNDVANLYIKMYDDIV